MTDSFLEANDDVLSGGDGFFLDSSCCLQSKRDHLLDETTSSLQENDITKEIEGVSNDNVSTLRHSVTNLDDTVTVVVSDDDKSYKSTRSEVVNDMIGCNSNSNSSILDQSQLENIANFLQGQSHSPNNNKGVVYYAPTNTRIVYQILYPDTEPKVSSEINQEKVGTNSGGSTTKPRKQWGRKFEENEEKVDSPKLSRQEKLAKKKQKSRTRSGRVSKPPSYMMKDYKRLHHLDYDEEPYDDSDGGYSDIQFSAEESNDVTKISDPVPSGIPSKSRNYKCLGCEKAYIGRAGLARHLKMNPDHGQMEHIKTNSNEGSAAIVSSLIEPDFLTSPAIEGMGTTESVPLVSNEAEKEKSKAPNIQKANAARRRTRLKALLKYCRDDEIMDLVMPRLARRLSTWQFLLKKCEVGSSSRHNLDQIQAELSTVMKEAEEMAHKCLVSADSSSEELGNSYLNVRLAVADHRAAKAMGIVKGTYVIKDNLDSEERVERTTEILTEDLLEDPTGSILDVDGGNGWSLGDSEILDILNQDSLSLDSNSTLLMN